MLVLVYANNLISELTQHQSLKSKQLLKQNINLEFNQVDVLEDYPGLITFWLTSIQIIFIDLNLEQFLTDGNHTPSSQPLDYLSFQSENSSLLVFCIRSK